MFDLEPGERYDMPVVFGPSLLPAVTEMSSVCTVNVGFLTDPRALEPLVPYHFTLGEPARVTIAHTTNRGVDYLGGRGYNIVRVTIPALYRRADRTIAAVYNPVIWESDTNPIIAGREWGGYAKIHGRIPDLEQTPDGCSFECWEYDARLLRAELTGLTPLVGEQLAAVQRASAEVIALGWKYIPGCSGGADVDYPTRLVGNYDYTEAFVGTGSVRFERPDPQAAPFSSRILAVLASLPVLSVEPATVLRGSMKLPRVAVERLG
jgi:hypothetical protein